MANAHTKNKTISPHEYCKQLAESVGAIRAAKQIGISRDTLTRVVGGMPVRPGSIAMIDLQIAKLNGGAQ